MGCLRFPVRRPVLAGIYIQYLGLKADVLGMMGHFRSCVGAALQSCRWIDWRFLQSLSRLQTAVGHATERLRHFPESSAEVPVRGW